MEPILIIIVWTGPYNMSFNVACLTGKPIKRCQNVPRLDNESFGWSLGIYELKISVLVI